MKYTVVLERDEDGYFVASVPALPGCFTQGKTLEEVMSNAKEAIELYIEDLKKNSEEVPEDRTQGTMEVEISASTSCGFL